MIDAPSHLWAVRIAWLLVHSFWQAGILWGCFALARRGMEHPRSRARLANGTMLVFVLAQALTLALLIAYRPSFSISAEKVAELTSARRWDGSAQLLRGTATFGPELVERFAWLLPVMGGIAGAICMVVAGLSTIALVRLRAEVGRCPTVDEPQADRFTQLANRLGLRRAVRFVRCASVSVPATVGQFPPVVLLPHSSVFCVAADELDAIVLHELAHVSRWDFALNALREAIRYIYLLNPFVACLAIASRHEAEAAADDLAATAFGDRRGYAAALLTAVEARASGLLMLGVGGGNLRARITGVLQKRGRTRRRDGFTTLAAVFAASCSLLYAGNYASLAAAEHNEIRWIETHSLGQAIVATFGRDCDDGRYAGELRRAVAEFRATATISAATMDALSAASTQGVPAKLLYEKACRDHASLKSIYDFGEYGTTGELETIVRMLADGDASGERLVAAVVLSGVLEVGDGGLSAQRLLQRPELLARLHRTPGDLYRLQRAVSANAGRITRLLGHSPAREATAAEIANFLLNYGEDVTNCRQFEFGLARDFGNQGRTKALLPWIPETCNYLRAVTADFH